MSYQATDEVLVYSRATGAARIVLAVLAHRCWHKENPDRLVSASNADLELATQVSRRHVKRAIDELEELGELRVVDRGGGRGNVPLYAITDLRALYDGLEVPAPGVVRPKIPTGQRPLVKGVTTTPNSAANGDTVAPFTSGNGDIKGATKGDPLAPFATRVISEVKRGQGPIPQNEPGDGLAPQPPQAGEPPPGPRPTGNRRRTLEAWQTAVIDWAKAQGVTGANRDYVIQAFLIAEPWQPTSDHAAARLHGFTTNQPADRLRAAAQMYRLDVTDPPARRAA